MSRLLVLVGLALLALGASQAWLIVKSGGETVKTYTLAEAYDKLFEPLSESKSTELWASTMYYSIGLLPIAGLAAAAGLVSRRLAAIGGTLLALAGLMWIASVYMLSNAAPEGYTANTGAGPLLALAGGIAVAAGGTSRGSSAASEAQRRIAGTRPAYRARRAVRRSRAGGYSSYSPEREYHYYHDHYREEHYIDEDSGERRGEDQGRDRGSAGKTLAAGAAGAALGAAAGYAAAKAMEEEEERSEEENEEGFMKALGGEEAEEAPAEEPEEEEERSFADAVAEDEEDGEAGEDSGEEEDDGWIDFDDSGGDED